MKRSFFLTFCIVTGVTCIDASEIPEGPAHLAQLEKARQIAFRSGEAEVQFRQLEQAVCRDDDKTVTQALKDIKTNPHALLSPEDFLYLAAKFPNHPCTEVIIEDLFVHFETSCDAYYLELETIGPIIFFAAKYGNIDYIMRAHQHDPSILNKTFDYYTHEVVLRDFSAKRTKHTCCVLNVAVRTDRPRVLEKLLELGANVETKNEKNQTPLELAHGECFRILQSWVTLHEKKVSPGNTPLHTAMAVTLQSTTPVLLPIQPRPQNPLSPQGPSLEKHNGYL